MPTPYRRIACALFLALVLPASAGAQLLDCHEEARLVATAPVRNADLGWGLAVAGDHVIAGAPGDDDLAGQVHVFSRSAGWAEVQVLIPSASHVNDEFGDDIDIDGDLMVVGASGDAAAGFAAGAVYIYRRIGSTWVEDARIEASDASEGSRFGRAVALDGNRLAVGAFGEDSIARNAGAVYVFELSAGAWVERAKLVSDDLAENDGFGFDVALAGDLLLVGAYAADVLEPGSGAAYVFRHSGTWNQEAKLWQAPANNGDRFGWSLDIQDEQAAIGAPRLHDGRESSVGGVFIHDFDRIAHQWIERALLRDRHPENIRSGHDVAIDEDLLVSGSWLNNYADFEEGLVTVYRGAAGSWIVADELDSDSLEEGDGFGRHVALQGSVIAVGAFGTDVSRRDNAGAVYVFSCSDAVGPTCDAGPDLAAACGGLVLAGATVGPASEDLQLAWTSSCAGTVFLPDAHVLEPTVLFASSCAQSCELTLTVEDDSGQSCSSNRIVTVDDLTAPQLIAPDDLSVACPAPVSGPLSEAAWLATASATDGCGDAIVRSELVEVLPGCGDTYTHAHELWAEDDCGNASGRVRRSYQVVDTTPPELLLPDDLIVECPAPSSGPFSEAAWLGLAGATDDCGDVSVMSELVEVRPGCGDTYTNVHEFWAVDGCGNASERVQRLHQVVDTTPPEFDRPAPAFQATEWPPNHAMVVYDTDSLVTATDGCGPAIVTAESCASSQPEDGAGDGHTLEDCLLSLDGRAFAVRAERQGGCDRSSSRLYTVIFTARDACGNEADTTGEVRIAHGQGPSTPLGRRLDRRAPLPFSSRHETSYAPSCHP